MQKDDYCFFLKGLPSLVQSKNMGKSEFTKRLVFSSVVLFPSLTGLPLTFRLRKSQTSYPSNIEVLQENLGSPTFFRAAAVCPFFSRT